MSKEAGPAGTPENTSRHNGESKLFEEIWTEYYPKIYIFLRTGFGFSREDLEDLTQDTLLKAYSRYDTYNSVYAISTWMYTIARNLAVDWFRKRKRRAAVTDTVPLHEAEPAGREESPEAELLNEETRIMIKSALLVLKPRDRQIAFLWFYEEIPQKRIAEILKVPAGTIKYRIHEIKKILTSRLEGNV